MAIKQGYRILKVMKAITMIIATFFIGTIMSFEDSFYFLRVLLCFFYLLKELIFQFHNKMQSQHSRNSNLSSSQKQPITKEINQMSKDDSSLIYELLRKNESNDHIAQRVALPLTALPENEQKGTDNSDYGELLQVKELFIKDEVLTRQIIKNNHEHVEDASTIKVFIDPNPTKLISRNQSKLIQIENKDSKLMSKQKSPKPFEGRLIPQQKQNFSIRIQDMPREVNREQPKTTRKKTRTISRQGSSECRSSQGRADQTDSFEDYKQFKKRKRENGVKMLAKKVQNLQKKLRQLKNEKQQLQKLKIVTFTRQNSRRNIISSNLINVKVQSKPNLAIMDELKQLRQKVQQLDRAQANSSRTAQKIGNDQYVSLSPADLAESNFEPTSNLIYSQAREKSAKITGRIFKKQAISINNQPSPYKQEAPKSPYKRQAQNILEKEIIAKSQPEIKNKSAIAISVEHLRAKDPHKKQQQMNQKKEHFDAEKDKQQQKFSQIQKIREIQSEILPMPNNINNNTTKQVFYSKERHEIQEGRGFVRSGYKQHSVPTNKNYKQELDSLKMLEFDTGNQKFIVDSHTEEDAKPRIKSNQITSFTEALQQIPVTPFVTRFPNYQTTEQQLVQMGKQLFRLFKVLKIEDDQTVLRIRKYKNCAYFGVDSENNILLHYEGRVYYGGWKEFLNGQGQKSGEGLQYHDGKFVYKGHFQQGKRSGSGILKVVASKRISIYIGQFSDGVKHGEGKQFDDDGVRYEGQWKEGKKHGFGKLILGNMQSFQGNFDSGLKFGYGTQNFKNGDIYQGQYKNGKFQGRGRYSWSNGAVYEGFFQNGMRNGKGWWSSGQQNGDQYEGQYCDDLKHGYGVYKWANGSKYEGGFFKDQKHGNGILTHQNGKVSQLTWDNGIVTSNQHPQKHQQQMNNNSHNSNRNQSKSVPANKKGWMIRQKQPKQSFREQQVRGLINNQMFKNLKSSSASSLPKGIVQNRHLIEAGHRQSSEKFKLIPHLTERPQTSKTISSAGNNFRIQKKNLGKQAFPRDPPYKSVRPTANINNF